RSPAALQGCPGWVTPSWDVRLTARPCASGGRSLDLCHQRQALMGAQLEMVTMPSDRPQQSSPTIVRQIRCTTAHCVAVTVFGHLAGADVHTMMSPPLGLRVAPI